MLLRGLIILVADSSTWSKILQDLVSAEQVAVTPYNLELGYDYWSYRMCVNAVLHSSGIVLKISRRDYERRTSRG